MNDRLKWVLVRRRRLARAIEGFSASPWSHATQASIGFEALAWQGDHTVLDESNERLGTFRDATPW